MRGSGRGKKKEGKVQKEVWGIWGSRAKGKVGEGRVGERGILTTQLPNRLLNLFLYFFLKLVEKSFFLIKKIDLNLERNAVL